METYGTLAYYFHIHVRCPPDSGLAASADEEIKQCGSKTAVDKVEDDVLQHGSKLTLLEVITTACERLFSLGCVSTPGVAVMQGKVSALESSQGSTSPRAAEGDGQAGGGGGGMDRQASLYSTASFR